MSSQVRILFSPLKSGSSSVGRAIAFQAIGREFEPRLPLHLGIRNWVLVSNAQSLRCCCSSGVEHFLGKEEVEGSIPFNSSGKLLIY